MVRGVNIPAFPDFNLARDSRITPRSPGINENNPAPCLTFSAEAWPIAPKPMVAAATETRQMFEKRRQKEEDIILHSPVSIPTLLSLQTINRCLRSGASAHVLLRKNHHDQLVRAFSIALRKVSGS